MKKISKRDVKVFLLGMLTMLLVVLLYDWSDFVQGIKAGYTESRSK